jgi:RNA-binding protein
MELSERQRKYLRSLGHALNPVLLVGQHGMTAAVIAEAQRALHDHELIKVKFRGAERDARDAGLAQLASATQSILVQRIGHTALYYKRRNDRPGIVIPTHKEPYVLADLLSRSEDRSSGVIAELPVATHWNKSYISQTCRLRTHVRSGAKPWRSI